MALKKLIEEKNGTTAEYWKIKAIEINPNSVLVRVAGYKNETFRQEDLNNFVERKNFTLTELNFENPIFSECYTKYTREARAYKKMWRKKGWSREWYEFNRDTANMYYKECMDRCEKKQEAE